ncbi:hypothetical protein N9Z27_01560 [Alphaproteobacteria bacterium]|nr:hypothetical protein [Alphaproteobacteria bacterium]
MKKTKLSKLLLTITLGVTLSACQTTNAQDQTTRSDKIDAALEQAATAASISGNKKQSLAYLEKIYSRKRDNPVAAINYGKALKEAKEYERAAIVLAPFANDIEAPAAAKTEYAGIQLALGNNDEAEKYAQKAVIQDDKQFKAFHYLGIALDAKTQHVEAERAYKKGLENWQGDPVPIMNNLSLNLASQGHLDEALEILKKAKSLAPNRIEVERNIRIVKALQESYTYSAP